MTQNLSENTVVLALTLGQVSNRRKLSSSTEAIKTEIDRDMLHVGIDLYDAPELKACRRFLTSLKLAVRSKTVPSFLKGGMYMVKVEAVEEIDALLFKAREDFRPLVEAFAAVADERKEESRARLGSAFNPGLYPTAEQINALYRIDWKWLTMSTPDSLKKISVQFFEREREKQEEALQEAVHEITNMLTLEAKGLADHMVDRLTPDEDGKPKIFRNSMVSNITEFLANFKLRDVGSSEELQSQVERMRKLTEGVQPDDLRKSDSLRQDVHEGFKRVAQTLDSLVMQKPKRKINLREEA